MDLPQLVVTKNRNRVKSRHTATQPDAGARSQADLLADARQERDQLRALIESISDEIWFCDQQGEIVLVNSAAARGVGFSREDDLLRPVKDLYAEILEVYQPDGTLRPAEESPMLLSLSGASLQGEEVVNNLHTGRLSVRQYSCAPIVAEDGQVLGSISVVRDVTQQKQVEQRLQAALEELQKSEQRFHLALENSPISVYTTDRELRYTWTYNPIHGLEMERVIGKRDDELFPVKDASELLAFKQSVLRTGKGARQEIHLKIRNKQRVFDVNAEPMRGDHRKVVGLTVAMVDITDRKRIEEERLHLLEQVWTEQKRLETVLTHMPAGVVIAEAPSGKITSANEQVMRILRLPAGQNLQVEDLRGFHGDWRPYRLDEWPLRRSILHGEVVQGEEIVVRRGDNTFGTILVNSAPICDATGAIVAAVEVFYDITERKRNERVLEDYANQLERSNKDLEDFAFIASHDLQEPLRKIRAFGDLLKDDFSSKLGDQGRDYILRMQDAADRMNSMIQDLLDYSRVTTRARSFECVDLSEVAAATLSDLEARVEDSRGRVEVGPLPEITADPMQMRQLLQNLIANALKFHRKGVDPQVRVYARAVEWKPTRKLANTPGEPAVEIIVEDNGIGIEEAFLDRIFQPFQRLHGRSAYEGSGIGLAICRKIVERHHGSITATSMPNNGSIFTVTLPVEQAEKDGQGA